jgi:hypothetical protein
MRPRHFASENFAGLICTRKPHWSFNEAEAFCLGKPWTDFKVNLFDNELQ